MAVIRVATYNIHKGVQGFGPLKRLEIHNLGHAIEKLDAALVCLQEVRHSHRRESRRFAHWPQLPQADFLAPDGFEAVYRTNAVTRHGEHGNALLSRWPVVAHQHEDMSDHRFEQRGLLHVTTRVHGCSVHVLVLHLGLVRSSRIRQLQQMENFVLREIPPDDALVVAGDFNEWGDWVAQRLQRIGLCRFGPTQAPTFPARLPLVQLDHVYARGMEPLGQWVPRGAIWARMSDHLPLVAEFRLKAG